MERESLVRCREMVVFMIRARGSICTAQENQHLLMLGDRTLFGVQSANTKMSRWWKQCLSALHKFKEIPKSTKNDSRHLVQSNVPNAVTTPEAVDRHYTAHAKELPHNGRYEAI